MASVLIKDIPEDLHRRLKEAAARDHRSMSKEVIAILEAALSSLPAKQLPPPIRPAFPITAEWIRQAIEEGRE